jgi:hypothetical protein
VDSNTTEWEKIFASCSSDKELIFRVDKELQNLNTKGIKTLINKWEMN